MVFEKARLLHRLGLINHNAGLLLSGPLDLRPPVVGGG